MSLRRTALRAVLAGGHRWNRRVIRPVRERLFGWREPFVVPFVGHVVERRLLLHGRVLRSGAIREADPAHARWRNLANMLRLFVTHEVVGARLGVRYGGVELEVRSDDEGYFDVDVSPVAPDAGGPLWQSATIELRAPVGRAGATSTDAPVLVHPMTARYAVISDIDDTVVATHVTSRLRLLATVMLSNAHTRLPFEGIGALYRALERGHGGGEHNPIFYVSNGPWNLHDLLASFFRLNGIPLGPIYLRDFNHRLLLADAPGAHKRESAERILREFPSLGFVLIGDSGEHDPEIYAELALRHPKRIRAIYIRCVHSSSRRIDELNRVAAVLSGTATHFVLAADTEAAARDAVALGLIPGEALAPFSGLRGSSR